MVPVSWLLARFLQQWEHEAKTMQREDDKNGVSLLKFALVKTAKAAGEEEGPHLQVNQAREVPQAVGDGAGELIRGEVPEVVGG